MPTPVSSARQFLTDEAARALDDAVIVARRRCHAQTTSLHAVSSLLSLPSSSLREACCRARTSVRFSSNPSFSHRLQLRALELSVGVSLDRLPSATSKTTEEPPISNSLMAAIKRSQANQRRSPESFHFYNQNQNGSSLLKVELKHFVLSILDDPIVNRVFDEAGFRSCDVKLALLQPPVQSSSRFFSPPVFLCNLEPGRTGLTTFPLGIDENSRRISEVILKKKKRNPFLMGVYAKDAFRSFVELLQKGRGGALFPPGMSGLNVVCVEKEIHEFLKQGGSEEKMSLRFKELGCEVEKCLGPGVIVGFGEIEVFVGDSMNDVAAVKFVVSELTRLLEIHGEKIWLMGVAENSEAYSKFLSLFPGVENDWDLHLLTVTSATPSMEGLYSKSSLMGSFVPFGGFFSTPSESKSPVSSTNSSFTRCDKCNEKYEQEVADFLKNELHHPVQTNEENTNLNDKISEFQKKWNDICQRLHQTRSQVPSLEVLRFGSGFKESSSKDPSHNELQCSTPLSYMPKELHGTFPSKQLSPVPVHTDTVGVNVRTDHVPKVTETRLIDVETRVPPSRMANMSVLDNKSSSSVTPVTTDLGLGTLYTPIACKPDIPKFQDKIKHFEHFSQSASADCVPIDRSTSHQIARSSCAVSNLAAKFDSVDFKSLNQLFSEKVGWQDQAICDINRTLFLRKSGEGKSRDSHGRADIWFAFLGPDVIGKKKIASVLAETIFGNAESIISVDLGFRDRFYPSNSIFECQKSFCYDLFMRKTVNDYIAGELSKNPHSVVFLEDVDKADFLVQSSLLQAIRRGKFPDSHGREISINNTIFILTSTASKGNGSSASEHSKMFFEETILDAKRYQMQLLLGDTSEDATRSFSTNVKIVPRKGFSKPSFPNKRKQADTSDIKEGATSKMQKQVRETSMSNLDLNMPLEEGEEGMNDNDLERETVVENSDSWFSDFCDHMDEKVIFKPFNFNVLAEKLQKNISIQFQKTFGSEFQLEIDYEVMTQILAAAWLSDKKNAVNDWIESVLGKSFIEAQKKYHHANKYVVKLVNCESIFVEEPNLGICLPASINMK
ncbi:Double Clp-N motif-containing P-loop nucleoside triphosphate hydrolase superfamily protein [Trifolium repens]|nr:Double Clp-N motif-containing P-loop nucleoside triphosphate hydrolase superfamily protein [Trifolium repens]